jgi:hypothetical protein
MSPAGHRDSPGQNAKCPSFAVHFDGPDYRDTGTQPYRGVPVSRCPGNRPSWETDQAAFDFEERAAIREYEGGLPRAAAERLARFDQLVPDRQRAVAA